MNVNEASVVLDPAAVATGRVELDLNSGPISIDQPGPDWGDAAIQATMADQQIYGAVPSWFRVPNRIVTIPLTVSEAARPALTQKVAALQQDGGGWLERRSRPGGSPVYADVENASLAAPDTFGEWQGIEPGVKLVLECLPDFYGDMVTLDTISASGETQAVLQQGGVPAVIGGDYLGRAQITVINGSATAQYGLIWGFRAHNYSSATAAGMIWPAASTLTPAAGATVSALSGARGGQTIAKSVSGAWADVAYGSGTHVGSYRVKARVYSASSGVQLRLGWAIGDRSHGLQFSSPVTVPGPTAFYLVDLGQVRFDPLPIGAQQWAYAIQATQPSGASATVYLDMLYLQPLDEPSGQLEGDVANVNPVLLGSGRLQMRYDSVVRSLAGGTAFAPVGGDFSDRARIPVSGMEQRPVQLFLKPSRGDLASNADTASQDSFTVSVAYRPSYLFRP